MKNTNNKKENRSMYLYTALIFAMALLLIIIAFFSQTNISKLGNRANEIAAENTAVPAETQTPTVYTSDEFARLSNMAAALDAENKQLKETISVYDKLSDANGYISDGNTDKAEEIINDIDETTLSDNQNVFYNEIKNKLNERKEQ